MLHTVDRVQLAVPDAKEAMQRWVDILDGEPDGVEPVAEINAIRHRLRLGRGWIEFLEADGAGLVDDALRRRGAHLFAAGVTSQDLGGLKGHLNESGTGFEESGSQIYIHPEQCHIDGLRLLVSEFEDREPVGLIDYLYESTLLTAEPEEVTAKIAAVFNLDAGAFVTINSPKFGYHGSLTLFRAGHLHRFEIISPDDPEKTMARFFHRTGQDYYMSFAETPHILEIERRAKARGDGVTVDRPADRAEDKMPDQLWLHPKTLGGMMLGISRPTRAWHWSGSPERVSQIA